MTDFDALLTRSFAEAAEPADDGFSVKVERAVAQREAALKIRNSAYVAGMALAGAAVAYGAFAVASVFGEDALAVAGLEIARAHSALIGAPSMSGAAQGVLQSFGAGLTQILLATAALAGGAVAYRAAQD